MQRIALQALPFSRIVCLVSLLTALPLICLLSELLFVPGSTGCVVDAGSIFAHRHNGPTATCLFAHYGTEAEVRAMYLRCESLQVKQERVRERQAYAESQGCHNSYMLFTIAEIIVSRASTAEHGYVTSR